MSSTGPPPKRLRPRRREEIANLRHFRTGTDSVRPSAPASLDWEDLESFKELGHFVKKTAQELGIDIVWGETGSLAEIIHTMNCGGKL